VLPSPTLKSLNDTPTVQTYEPSTHTPTNTGTAESPVTRARCQDAAGETEGLVGQQPRHLLKRLRIEPRRLVDEPLCRLSHFLSVEACLGMVVIVSPIQTFKPPSQKVSRPQLISRT
jgi:hypothetical protein